MGEKLYKEDIDRHFFDFLKVPAFKGKLQIDLSNKFFILFRVFLITLGVLIIVNLITSIFTEFNIAKAPTHILENITKYSNKNQVFIYLIILFTIAPIIEEIIFRYPLSSFSNNKLALSLSLLVGFHINNYFHNYLWQPNEFIFSFLVSYIYIFGIALILYFIFKGLIYLLLRKIDLESRWDVNSRMIFYISALFFSVSHLTSLNINKDNIFLLPLTMFSYIVMGLSLGYIRINLGLIYSIIMHYLFNLPTILMILFLSKK